MKTDEPWQSTINGATAFTSLKIQKSSVVYIPSKHIGILKFSSQICEKSKTRVIQYTKQSFILNFIFRCLLTYVFTSKN